MGELIERLRKHANGLWDKHPRGRYGICDEAADELSALRETLSAMCAAQQVEPYRGWNLTALNLATDKARSLLGLQSVRDLNPDIAAMQDHAAASKDAIRAILSHPQPSNFHKAQNAPEPTSLRKTQRSSGQQGEEAANEFSLSRQQARMDAIGGEYGPSDATKRMARTLGAKFTESDNGPS